jgi:TonB family protein
MLGALPKAATYLSSGTRRRFWGKYSLMQIGFLLATMAGLMAIMMSVSVPAVAHDTNSGAADMATLRTPSTNDLSLHYPRAAFRAGVAGSVLLNCAVSAEGYLTDCFIVSELPVAQGFGLAALRLAAKYQLAEQSKSGKRQRGVRFDIKLGFSTE